MWVGGCWVKSSNRDLLTVNPLIVKTAIPEQVYDQLGSDPVLVYGDGATVASNHLQGPHRESPKAMRKLSDTLIDGHLGQRRYQSRKNDHI